MIRTTEIAHDVVRPTDCCTTGRAVANSQAGAENAVKIRKEYQGPGLNRTGSILFPPNRHGHYAPGPNRGALLNAGSAPTLFCDLGK